MIFLADVSEAPITFVQLQEDNLFMKLNFLRYNYSNTKHVHRNLEMFIFLLLCNLLVGRKIILYFCKKYPKISLLDTKEFQTDC